MKIPTATRQVTPQVGNVPTPAFAQPVRGAFGENVARAKQGTADVGMKLAGLLEKRAFKRQEIANNKIISDINSNLMREGQDKMYNPEDGWMTRQLGDAKGSVLEADAWFKTAREKALEGAPTEELRQRLAVSADGQYSTMRGSIIGNEVKQDRQNTTNSLTAEIDLIVQEAINAQDDKALERALDSVLGPVDTLNKHLALDDDSAELNRRGVFQKVVDMAIKGALARDISGRAAKDLLLSVKGILHEDEYKKTEESMMKMAKKQIEINDFDDVLAKNSMDDSVSDMYSKGELTVTRLKVLKQQNPVTLTDTAFNSWEKVLESEKAVLGNTDSAVYHKAYKDFFDIFSTVEIKKLKKKKGGKKQFEDLLSLRAEVITNHANGLIDQEDYAEIEKLFSAATTENTKFMKYYAPYNTVLDLYSQWAEKVMVTNSRAIGAEGISPEGVFTDNLTMKAYNNFLSLTAQGGKLNPIRNPTDGATLTAKATEVLTALNKQTAMQLYDISQDPSGQEFVRIKDSHFKVFGYSNGGPIIEYKEIKETFEELEESEKPDRVRKKTK